MRRIEGGLKAAAGHFQGMENFVFEDGFKRLTSNGFQYVTYNLKGCIRVDGCCVGQKDWSSLLETSDEVCIV